MKSFLIVSPEFEITISRMYKRRVLELSLRDSEITVSEVSSVGDRSRKGFGFTQFDN